MANEVIPIEQDVPIPPYNTYRKPSSKYTVACESLEVGQSFVVYGDKEKDRARGAAQRTKQKYEGRNFVQRKLENGFYRLWRVS